MRLGGWVLGWWRLPLPHYSLLLNLCHACLAPTGHMAFSFVVLAPVALRQPWKVHRRSLEKQWKGRLV